MLVLLTFAAKFGPMHFPWPWWVAAFIIDACCLWALTHR